VNWHDYFATLKFDNQNLTLEKNGIDQNMDDSKLDPALKEMATLRYRNRKLSIIVARLKKKIIQMELMASSLLKMRKFNLLITRFVKFMAIPVNN